MNKSQVNLALFFCQKNKQEYLQKVFRYIYFYEILHCQKLGKSFSNFTIIADERFPVIKELWDSIVLGELTTKYSDKFKIFCPNRVKDYRIGDIRSMKIIGLTDVLDEDLRWTEPQKILMDNLKFKFSDAVPSQMNEIFATNTNFWQEMVKRGNNNKKINFEDLITVIT